MEKRVTRIQEYLIATHAHFSSTFAAYNEPCIEFLCKHHSAQAFETYTGESNSERSEVIGVRSIQSQVCKKEFSMNQFLFSNTDHHT